MALKQNIIYIYFKGKHQVTSKSQYQYNRKQYLYFADLNLPQVFEVHFSNRDKGESKTQIGNDKLVEIPDEYFWNGALQIYAWIYLHSGADDSETIYEIRIPLTKRAKPTDEEPLPVQQSAIDKAIAELNNAVNVTTENVNKTESDKIIVANIKDEVVDLKEDIDSTAATINQKAQETINASGRAEASALNAADSERKALNYSQQAEQSAQEALESKTIAKQKAEIATGASAEALGYRDEAVSARDIAVQAKQNIVDYRDETKGYKDETLTAKNNVQTLKNQIDETAEEIEDISDAVKEDAQSASQSASSANQSSINASESASQAGRFADGAEQSANQAEQSMNTTEDYKNQSETFKNQAEEFKNQTETNVSHYPKIVNDYWYIWDATNREYVNTNVDANGIKGDKGNGIQSAVLNNDYTLTLTFTDGTTYTTPSIRGEKGEQGEPATDMDIHICSASEYDSETRIPTITSPDDKTFYLVPTEDGTSPDLFTEWVYVNNAWEMFGSAKIDLTDYVKNTDIATTTKAGIVKINPTYGVGIFNDTLVINGAFADEVKAGNNSTKAVSTYRQHESTFYGLAKASGHDEKDSTLPVGQYTDEAKSSIQNMLDVPSTSELKEVNDSKADVIVESASGDIVSFDDGADDMPLKSLVVDINPVQDLNGYDSPWVGGGGKNLLDSLLLKDQEAWNIIPIKVKPNTAYTASTDKPSISGMPAYFTINNTGGGGGSNNLYVNHSVTITSTEDGYVYFSQRRASGEDSFANYHFQVEEGSTATDWTPYENVCPINGWNGVDIVASGYNIWDEEWEGGALSSGIPAANATRIRSKNFISVAPNTTYYAINTTASDGNLWLSYYDLEKIWITSSSINGNFNTEHGASFTVPDNCYYIKFFVANKTTYTGGISINYPSTDHDYHPYAGRSIQINWQSEAGTVYGGHLDVVSGVMTVDRAMVDLGTLNWISEESYAIGQFRVNQGEIAPLNPNYSSVQCSILNGVRPKGYNQFNNGEIGLSNSPIAPMLRAKAEVFIGKTAEEIKAIMQGQQLCYELAEPIEIQLSPNQMNSLYGQNNLWADSGDTEVVYRADTKKFIERLTAPDSADMIADANITSGQYFMVGNNLFKATANIANGSAIIVGTNAVRKSLSEALNEINA